MPDATDKVELAIDTAGALAGVAVSHQGLLLAELNWCTRNNHSSELVPAIDVVLTRAGVEREQIGVLCVDRGPGGYGGLRTGISTAMGLALGLGGDLVAVGRLELDAYAHAAYPGPICAVHQAGRGDVAWAIYGHDAAGDWTELQAPRLGSVDDLAGSIPVGTMFCGEWLGLQESLATATPAARFATGVASTRRAATLSEVGWQRYVSGVRDNPVALEPLYLREPAITKAKPRPASV
jgi:tRNA threonylcarbamoyladenosine biosynthesis protein TsaB